MSYLPTMPVGFQVFIFIAGACVGSFLNVCIFRIPAKESILFPASRCPSCLKSIPFYLNIPIVSFFVLKGRCRICGVRISPRYPTVEAISGTLALALLYKFGPGIPFFFWGCFASALIVITFIDLDHQIIPDRISLPGILVFSLSALVIPGMTLWDTALGIMAGGGLPYALAMGYYWVRKEQGLGGGDIKLLAMIGAATGLPGVLFALFLGSVSGTAYGLMTMWSIKKENRRLKIPFGPFLSLGALVYLFWGQELMDWYFGLIVR